MALTAFSQDGKASCPASKSSGLTRPTKDRSWPTGVRVPATGDWKLEGVKRSSATRGWSQQPQRWTVERTVAWLLHSRRLFVDYARSVQTSATFIEVALIRLLVARLGRQA